MVTILVLLSMAILQATRIFGARAAAQADAARAAAATASGMEYAAARLTQSAMPGKGDVPGRGDDWTDRQGSDHPSYSHGESWIEAGTPDGVFTPTVETAFADRDMDGSFSAWSGRLRGGSGRGIPFLLRIASAEGKIPLNAGLLSNSPGLPGFDDNANGAIDEGDAPPYSGPNQGEFYWDSTGNGIYDCHDLKIPYHAGLAHALNSLGATLKRGSTHLVNTRRAEVPSSGDPIPCSWLGYDLITCRPVGGYRSWAEVERTLTGLPNVLSYDSVYSPADYAGAPYTKAEVDAIRPFIDLGPYDASLDAAPYVPVSLRTAPREVLTALWTCIGGRFLDETGVMDCSNVSLWFWSPMGSYFPGEPGGGSALCPHSGQPFSSAPKLIWPEEAEALADEAIAWRAAGAVSWKSLRERLVSSAASIFARDAAALSAFPAYRASWLRMKANLAFQAVAIDAYPSAGTDRLSTWATWGIPQPAMGCDALFGIRRPAAFADSGSFLAAAAGEPLTRPQGLTLGSPVRFSVRSEARLGPVGARRDAAALEGNFRAAERLELASQEDFENATRGAFHSRCRGIEAKETPDYMPWTRRGAASTTSPPSILSLPGKNARSVSVPGVSMPYPGPVAGFPMRYGALTPATLDAGRGSAHLYWPYVEDFDGQPNASSRPAWLEMWPDQIPAPVPAWGTSVYDPSSTNARYRAEAIHPFWFSVSQTLNLPGLRTSLGPGWTAWDPIRSATLEAWMAPGAAITLNKSGAGPMNGLYLMTGRGYKNPARPGTYFILMAFMWSCASGYDSSFSLGGWVVEDDPVRPVQHYHVVLAWELLGNGSAGDPYRTRFSLRVNGSNAASDGTAMTMTHDGTFNAPGWASPPDGSMIRGWNYGTASLLGMDKLRIYEAVAAPSAPDRFSTAGAIYTSPLYDLNAPSSLLSAQWTGAVPPGTPDSALGTSVTGYRDKDGASPAGTVPLPAGLGADAAADLAALGMPPGVRSFRYQVRFAPPPGSGDLAPVFESIWITFRRRGLAPMWTSWETR